MPAQFTIERDDEFYVFLKSSLPPDYRIEATPSTSYYSEWLFHYELFRNEKLLKTIEGDYRSLKKGQLVHQARDILHDIEAGNK